MNESGNIRGRPEFDARHAVTLKNLNILDVRRKVHRINQFIFSEYDLGIQKVGIFFLAIKSTEVSGSVTICPLFSFASLYFRKSARKFRKIRIYDQSPMPKIKKPNYLFAGATKPSLQQFSTMPQRNL